MPKSVAARATLMTLMDILLFVAVFMGFFLVFYGFWWVMVNLTHLPLPTTGSVTDELTVSFLGIVFVFLPIFLVTVFVRVLVKDIYRLYARNKDICQQINKEPGP